MAAHLEATGNLIGSDYKTPYAIHITGGVQHAFNEHWLASADYTHEQGNHGYRAFPYTGGTNLLTPLIPASDPNYATDQANVVPNVNVFESDNRSSYNALMLHLQAKHAPLQSGRELPALERRRPGDACSANSLTMWMASANCRADRRQDSSMPSAPAITAPPAKTCAIALCWPARCTSPAVSK
jgi:hypothetical protein